MGNRSFCLPGVNCPRSEYEMDAIREAAEIADSLSPSEIEALLEKAEAIVSMLTKRCKA